MGICSSCESINVATAKLIHQDGRLQEFAYPVKVSYVLQKDPNSFICNADQMDFDDVVSAVDQDDLLHPGQLYFALPLTLLKHRLKAEDMASLAVKASLALMKNARGGTAIHEMYRGANPWKSSETSKIPSSGGGGILTPGVLSTRGCGGNRPERISRSRGNSREKFSIILSAIPE